MREPRGEVLVGRLELVEIQLRAVLVLQHRPRVGGRGPLRQAHQLVGPATATELGSSGHVKVISPELDPELSLERSSFVFKEGGLSKKRTT